MERKTTTEPTSAGPVSLTVVIPCKNGAELLPRQLEALAAEQYDGDWEVVVADNGSTDGSAAVAREYATRFARLTVVDASARPGQAFARNVGARAGSGAALCFVDADDEVAPGYLAALGTALREHPFVSASFDSTTLNQGWVGETRPVLQEDGLHDSLGFLPFAGGGGLGVTREVFDAVNGFDPDFHYSGQDVDFCWRVQLAGYPLTFVPEATVRVAWRTSHRALFKQGRRYGRGEVYLYRKYRAQGMRRTDRKDVRKRWRRLLRQVRHLNDDAKRGRWLRDFGRCVGRVQGSVRHGVIYL